MSVDSLIKMFEQYGWPGVLAVVCILIVYYFISKKDKKSLDTINAGFTGLATTMAKQNENLIDAITESNEKTQERLFTLINKSIDNKEQQKSDNHKKSISKRQEISEHIDEVLFDILLWSNAQRASIIEFHNSKENLDGLSFLWYDIQHEKQQKGIDTLSSKAKNLQATNLRPIIKRINNEKTHIIHLGPEDIENIYNESTVFYQYMKEIKASHLVYCGIYNNDTNELRAMLCLEYQEGYPYHEDLIDYFILKEKASLIEHFYNKARIDLANDR